MISKKILSFLLILILSACSNIKKEAEEAFKSGDYSNAAKLYKELIKDTEDAAEKAKYYERYAISSIQKGISIFNKRKKSMRPVESAIEKAEELVLEPSKDYLMMYTDLMADVANAYLEMTGNDYVKKQNEEKAIELLKSSLENFPDSKIARDKLTSISEAKYNEAIERADKYYKDSKKTRNKNQKENKLLLAESWYSYALSLRPDNEEIINVLEKIRPTTIKVLNDEETVVFVINNYTKKDNTYIFLVYLLNNVSGESEFKLENFTLKFNDGSRKKVDLELAKKLVSKNVLNDKVLQAGKQTGGVIAVESDADLYPVMLTYNDGVNKAQRKNLPKL